MLSLRCTLAICLAFALPCFASDITANIQSVVLKNGMTVLLAPSSSASTMNLEIEVAAGSYNEEPGKEGTAHLLEHYLFTDATIERNLTYLQIIQEKGGAANAETTRRRTKYYATVPKNLAPWVVDVFTKIIFTNSFEAERTEMSKGPVFLEIGRPSVFDYGTYVVQSFWPHFARFPDFMETEFGVDFPDHSKEEERIFTGQLRSTDLKKFYDQHYHPANLVAYVTGNFEPTAILSKISREWGEVPNRAGTGWTDPSRKVQHRNYVESSVSTDVPSVRVGTKFSGMSHEEEISVKIYLGSLAYRLMKDFRNARGETYTVTPYLDEHRGDGYAGIHFEAPSESYQRNLNQVRSMIEDETRNSMVSPEMFEEARSLFLKDIALSDSNADAMTDFAKRIHYVRTNFKNCSAPCSDYLVAKQLTLDRYLDNLKRIFKPNMRIETLEEPPLVFRFEGLVLLVIGFAAWMVIARKMFSRPYQHDGIRWVRKIVFPPAYTLNLAVLSFSILLGVFLSMCLSRLGANFTGLRASFLISDYLYKFVALGAVIFCCQCVMAICTRKLSVVGQTVIAKSLGFWSFRFELSEIKNIELLSPITVILSPTQWLAIKHRFRYYDLLIWRKGLLVRLKCGRSHFFSITDSSLALEEFQQFLSASSNEYGQQSEDQGKPSRVA